MNKKSILIVTPGYLPLLGGMEQQCYLLAKEFTRKKWKVTVLTEQTTKDFPLVEITDDCKIVRLPSGKRTLLTYLSLSLKMLLFLFLNRNDISFILVRTLTFPAIIIGLSKYLGIINCPTFATAETGGDFDDVIALKKYKFFKLFKNLLLQHTFLNSLNSDNLKHYRELKFPEEKLINIPNGVDISAFKNSIYPSYVKTFLFLGQLRKEKGIWELLFAFKKLAQNNDVKLIIAGSGIEENNIINWINFEKLNNRIIHLGRIEQKKLKWFFQQGECLVLPSYSEGLPLAVLEAAVHKKILLTTDVGLLKSIFKNQLIICRKMDEDDLYLKMKKIINTDFSELLSYSDIITNYDISKVANQWISLAGYKLEYNSINSITDS